MAGANRSTTSLLGILAIIVLIAAVVYFVVQEADDDALEIEIGLVQDVGAPPFPF